MAELSSDRPKDGQKIALVTGAAPGGIGGALAEQLHAAGYFVVCAVRRPSASASLVRPGIILVELDVSKTASVEAAAHIVSHTAGGRLDVLVNNAGAAHHRPVLDVDVDGAAADMFNVNVLGPMRMTKAFANLLIEAKGLIVNIGSVAPIAPMVYSSAYNMTKAALHSYGDSLAMEMEPFGVSVVTVITGGVKSNIVKEERPTLSMDSLFLPVEKFWQRRVTQSQSGSMDTTTYAKKVVGMIVKKKRPLWFWAGNKSFTVWLTYYLLPRWLRNRIMAKSYGGLHLLKAWWLKNGVKAKSS